VADLVHGQASSNNIEAGAESIEMSEREPRLSITQGYRWHIRNTPIEGSHVFVKYHLADKTEWIVDNEIPHPKAAPANASPFELIFLLSGAKSAPVDVELEKGLTHLGYF
jgi:hypothetical protein